MSENVISVEGVSKRYLLGAAERPQSMREAVSNMLTAPARRLRRIAAGGGEQEFWALKDVNFEVKRGEVVGVIGRNGAGKSTLLKVLSRITPPTAGRVRLRGRVASLLEVGTGFHPELTGRENIYLNGVMLGMSREEVRKKFDEIVAFSEIEKFIDTPVKRYSSGMYVRLAFAVAAHLEPEILIVDEVLAVGDAAFQAKCLGKMKEVSKGDGRTVLFVSHNMGAMRNLCTSGLVMSQGSVELRGPIEACCQRYLGAGSETPTSVWRRPTGKPRGTFCFDYCALELSGEQPNHRLRIDITGISSGLHRKVMFDFDVYSERGDTVLQIQPSPTGFIEHREVGAVEIRVEAELPPLIPGKYFLRYWVGPHNTETYDTGEGVLSFEVVSSPVPGRTFPHYPDHGYVVASSRVVSTGPRLLG